MNLVQYWLSFFDLPVRTTRADLIRALKERDRDIQMLEEEVARLRARLPPGEREAA